MGAVEIAGMSGGILIASASAGTGHLQAAEALKAALLARSPALRVSHVDVLEQAPSWVRAAYGDGFELLATRAPGIWRELYQRTDGPGVDAARWSGFAQRLLFRRFESVVRDGWDLCLCTHFLPAQLMAGKPGTPPFGMAVTDFGLHRYWAQPHVGRYFVATECLADTVRARVRRASVRATGIPVRPDLLDAPPRAVALADLGLDARRPVVTVMGGGLGLGVVRLAIAAAAARPDVQVLALCGRSESARAALAGVPSIRALGYVNDVRPCLAAADLVLTKPGGLSTSEALALGRPLLLASPIPGHEEENRRVLVRAGAAAAADDPEAIAAAVRRLVSNPLERERMSDAARRVGRPHAASEIAAAVERDFLLRDVA